jgi:SAM-dependent methyltransferase
VELPTDAYVVGIDVAADQLERNTSIQEKILGDIQTYPLPSRSFDLILCWDVLEHLPRPVPALENFVRALAPGGLLLLAGPNVFSLKGFVTKITPYSFHLAYYRRVSSCTPFKTYLRLACSPTAIRRCAERKQMSAQFIAFYEAWPQVEFRERIGLRGPFWSATVKTFRGVSHGLLDPSATDFMLVLSR